MIDFRFINSFVKSNHLPVIQTLFFLPGTDERMKQTDDQGDCCFSLNIIGK